MKDEILEEIKADILYCYKDWYITEEEYKRDLDYITNLQEEKDDYKHKFWEEQELNEYLQDRIDKVAERAMHIQKTYGYELSDLIFLLQGSDS